MNEPTMETLVRRLDRVERENRRLKRAGIVALGVIAAVVLIGQAISSKVAEAQAPDLAATKNAELPVYSRMDRTSSVLHTLKRGDLVEIDFVVRTPEGAWCGVTEIGGRKTSGFVRCEHLERRPTRPSEPLHLTEEPAPKPMAKVPEPEVEREKQYSVQVATLVVERNARILKKRLEKLGYTPVIRMTTAPITRHRVYGGEFSSREEAERTARRLNVDGFSANLVELEDGKFGLDVGSSFRLNEAIDLARSLQTKNYTPRILSKATPTSVHVVRVGAYEYRSEAREVLEALKSQGFEPLIVSQ